MSDAPPGVNRTLASSAGSISVLHVDDDSNIADLVALWLERENDRITVTTASSASEALDVLERGDVDCVVADQDMPGMTGIELLEAIREEDEHTPFILFTGKGSEEVASEAISAGVTDYLQKEGGTDQYAILANRIENAVSQHRSQRALEISQQRLSQFVEQSPLGVIEWDESFDIVRLNDAAEEILGYDEAELRGRSWETIVAPDDREPVGEVVSALLDAEGGHQSINRNLTRDGERIVCEWYNRVVTDDDGDLIAIFSQFQDVTERIEREDRLETTTARLQALFANAPDMIDVHDADGTIVDANPRFCEQLGYAEDELIGRKVWEIDRLVDPQRARAIWDDLALGERYELEGEYERRDGTTFPVEVHLRRLSVDGDDRFLATSRDVTERKERERELREAEARYRRLVEQNLVGIYVIRDRQFTYVNPRLAEIFGETPEAMIGRSPFEWIDESDHARVRENLRKRERGEVDSLRFTVSGTRADGKDVEFEVHGGNVEIDDAVVIIGALRDVTDRKHRSDAMAALHERIQGFMEAPDRQAAAEHAVETADTVLGLSATAVWLYDDADEVLEPVAVTSDGADIVDEVPTYSAGDSLSWRAFETGEGSVYDDLSDEPGRYNADSPLRSEIVLPLGEYGVMNIGSTATEAFNEIDVSLAQILADTLSAALDRVDREQALRAQRRELERRNERLDEFTSVVSHDLRNPLTVIQGAIDLAEETGDPDHFDRCRRAVERMERLIDDLLALARQGESIAETTRVDLADVAAESWKTVEADGATLDVRADRLVRADRTRLEQLLENLLSNAVYHGGDDVTITIDTIEGGFYVADDGRGIPDADPRRVFESGYSTDDQGTGFGLSIVDEIVDAHGWTIDATESADGGARFEITGVDTVD